MLYKSSLPILINFIPKYVDKVWKLHLVEVVTCPSTIFYWLTCWYFIIKTVGFHLKFFSKVDKMIYNSFLDTCWIMFAPKLPIKWSVFDQMHSTHFINFIYCIILKVKAMLSLVMSWTFVLISILLHEWIDTQNLNLSHIREDMLRCVRWFFLKGVGGAYEGGSAY